MVIKILYNVSYIVLLSLILFTCISKITADRLIALRTEGKNFANEINVIKIGIGSPQKTYRLALDFHSKYIKLRTKLNDISTTYCDTDSSDIVLIDNEIFRTNILYEPTAGIESECLTCDGTFGLNMNSPIWMRWGCARITTGSIHLIDCNNLPSEMMKCKHYNDNQFCVTNTTFLNRKLYLDIDLSTYDTFLPGDLYANYMGIKDVTRDEMELWDSISMKMLDGTTITIPPTHFISQDERGLNHIHIKSNHESKHNIKVGRSILRNSIIYVNPVHRSISFHPWTSERSPTLMGMALLLIATLLLVRWKTTNDKIWKASQTGPYPDREIIAAISVILAFFIIFVPSIRNAIFPFTGFMIYYFVMVSWCAISIIIAYAAYFLRLTIFVGPLFVAHKQKPTTTTASSLPTSSTGTNSVGGNTIGSTGKFGSSRYRLLQKTGNQISNGGNANVNNGNKNDAVIIKRLQVRLALMIDLGVTLLILLVTLVIISETRGLHLAGTMSLIFMSGLIVWSVIFLFMSIYYTLSIPPTLIWLVFVIGNAAVTGYTIAISYIYIIQPFIEESFAWPTWVPIIFSISYILFLVIIGIKIFLFMLLKIRRAIIVYGYIIPAYSALFFWPEDILALYDMQWSRSVKQHYI